MNRRTGILPVSIFFEVRGKGRKLNSHLQLITASRSSCFFAEQSPLLPHLNSMKQFRNSSLN